MRMQPPLPASTQKQHCVLWMPYGSSLVNSWTPPLRREGRLKAIQNNLHSIWINKRVPGLHVLLLQCYQRLQFANKGWGKNWLLYGIKSFLGSFSTTLLKAHELHSVSAHQYIFCQGYFWILDPPQIKAVILSHSSCFLTRTVNTNLLETVTLLTQDLSFIFIFLLLSLSR